MRDRPGGLGKLEHYKYPPLSLRALPSSDLDLRHEAPQLKRIQGTALVPVQRLKEPSNLALPPLR